MAESSAHVSRIVEVASGWRGVSASGHRYGGTEFNLGPFEVGRVHPWGLLYVTYPGRLRDAVEAEAPTNDALATAGPGGLATPLGSEADVERALWLLRVRYLSLVAVLQRAPDLPERVAELDVPGELDGLGVGERVWDAFESLFDPEERPPVR